MVIQYISFESKSYAHLEVTGYMARRATLLLLRHSQLHINSSRNKEDTWHYEPLKAVWSSGQVTSQAKKPTSVSYADNDAESNESVLCQERSKTRTNITFSALTIKSNLNSIMAVSDMTACRRWYEHYRVLGSDKRIL